MSAWTKTCTAELSKYYNKLPWLHSHPFCWTHACANGPEKSKNPWVKAHWYINAHLSIGYLCFVVCRTVEACNDPNQSLERQLYLVLMSVLYALETLYNTSMLCKCNSFIQFQRSHVKFLGDGETTNYNSIFIRAMHPDFTYVMVKSTFPQTRDKSWSTSYI